MSAFANAIRDEMPRLRRYAHGTIGSAELGDTCIATCLARLIARPDLLDNGLHMPVALYRLFHDTNGHVEASATPLAPQGGSNGRIACGAACPSCHWSNARP